MCRPKAAECLECVVSMEIWDQHVHSRYSKDAFHSMTQMALAEADAGIDGVCFTDHCDLEHYDTGLEDPDCWRPEDCSQNLTK